MKKLSLLFPILLISNPIMSQVTFASEVTTPSFPSIAQEDKESKIATNFSSSSILDENDIMANSIGTANLYVTSPSSRASYGGKGFLYLHTWPGETQQNSKMSNYYIVLPVGAKASDGSSGVQTAVNDFISSHSRIKGEVNVTSLGVNTNNQEVYQLKASEGAWIEKNTEGAVENFSQDLKVQIEFPTADSGETGFKVNASASNTFSDNVLWLGTGDGTITTDTGDYYPQVSAESVLLPGATDTYVRGPQGAVPISQVTYFNPRVTDSYNIIDSTSNEILKTVTKTGENLSSYSRVGLVDTLSNLGIDSTVYDESSLSIDSGTLSDDIILSSTDGFSSHTEQPGHTYTISVTAYKDELGGNVTAKYVDTEGNAISDNVVKSGNITDVYTTEQKVIDGYTFKEVKGDALGKFTKQPQTVTYVYTKNPVKGGDVTAKYVDTEGNAISDNVVKSGNITDVYTTEQKVIDGYTFKEVKGDALGKFTKQPQTVTYVYQKNEIAPTPKPDNHVDTPQSGNNSNNKTDSNTETKNTLPQTGENEGLSIIGMIFGLLIIFGTSIMMIFGYKKQD